MSRPGAIVRETIDLLLWQPGPFGFHDELARTGLAVELISTLAVLTAAYVLFRPLAAPRELPGAELRSAAAQIVEEHGTDTLSFFKLRGDKHYLFDPSGRAFVGYRAENGVLMISGDPVGDPAAVPGLMHSIVEFAEERSLRIAALGVSSEGRGLFEAAGLRGLYIGDEAIVDTATFSIEGPGDPEGAAVGVAAREGRLRDARRRARRAPTRRRWRSSSRSATTGAEVRPSAASAWRWTR